jgi:pSer/pThr/pTyr-binding forkhead associated (FHA) protein
MAAPVSDQPVISPTRLTWQTPEGEARERVLDEMTIVIGRGEDCDICILDEYASRSHAEIRFDGNTFVVADLGSINGTFLNKKRIEGEQALQDGDLLRIGKVMFHFEKPAPPPHPPPPPAEEAPKRITLVLPALAVTPYLEICSGPGKQAHFDLIKDKMTIGRAGRGQQWDLMLQDRAISRPQAQIARQAEGYVLTDLGSANGTLVNGAEISEPHVLKDGDAITFGETVLVFHAGSV